MIRNMKMGNNLGEIIPVQEGILFIAVFSLIPLAAAVRSYTKSGEMSSRFHHVQKNIVALVFFCVLVDGFLLIRGLL